MMNQELCNVEETEITFKRVDLNDPSSILSYGQDVIEQIDEYVLNATNVIENEKTLNSDFFRKVDNLSNFQEKLDKLEEERKKADNKSYRFLSKLIRRIQNKQNIELSYNQEYVNYVENVDLLVNDVNTMYENAKNDFNLFNSFINNIKPFVKVLQKVYDVGVNDKKVLEDEISYLETCEKNVNSEREIAYKKQVLDIFNDKLYSILKSQLSINNVIMQWNTRQINELRMLTSYQNFLSLDKSIIKLNGTALVGAKKQKEEAYKLNYLMNGVNNALIETSKQQNEAINSVNELIKDGNIKAETYKTIDSYIDQGISLLKQGSIEKKKNILTNTKALEEIKEHYNNFNKELKEQLLLDLYVNNNEINIKSLKKENN